MFTHVSSGKMIPPGRESIHSGQFMVSHFEAEEQDDEDEVAVPVPEVVSTNAVVPVKQFCTGVKDVLRNSYTQQHLSIDTSLSKLFQCMTLAYRQKLTSPKWNRFRGIRLRWKEKIRLNNVIWRCWHLQFIKRRPTMICQFASPLDVDIHNKPEAVVLEGKYWKRKLHAVTAEYKKWRMYHRHHLLQNAKDNQEMRNSLELLPWDAASAENADMMVDEDYLGLMSDTLFSTITNQPFHFPDSREIAKAGLADFIQPSLGPLQPNLDDYMDFEQEFINCKLPTVPEEQNSWNYPDLDLMTGNSSMQMNSILNTPSIMPDFAQSLPSTTVLVTKHEPSDGISQRMTQTNFANDLILRETVDQYGRSQTQPSTSSSPFQYPVISKNRQAKMPIRSHHSKYSSNALSQNVLFNKPVDMIYEEYCTADSNVQLGSTDVDIAQNRLQSQSQILQSPSCLQTDFRYVQQPPASRQSSSSHAQGYKFSAPPPRPVIKFTSQVPPQQMMHPAPLSSAQTHYSCNASFPVKEEIVEQPQTRTILRNRQRSRSNTREQPMKRPPLLSAMSDPALITSTNSVLLTQLLSNNSMAEQALPSNSSSVLLTQLLTGNSLAAQHEALNSQSRMKDEKNSAGRSTTTLIITSPVSITSSQQAQINDPLLLSSYSGSNSPILDSASSQCLNSPTSSQGSLGSPKREHAGGGGVQRDHRRAGHIHAEQKRRYNIKNGFDMIHSLIPHLNQNPNAKVSKAAMLQKGAEYIRQLRVERDQMEEEMESLRQQIETLNTSISNCQSMLPTNVAPVSIRRDTKMQELFDEYIRNRTMENWKFWIFSLIFRPLLVSFNNVVSTSSLEDLYRTTVLWVEQHCTLGELRPVVLNSLRYLCTKTDILTEPEKLPDEARQLSKK